MRRAAVPPASALVLAFLVFAGSPGHISAQNPPPVRLDFTWTASVMSSRALRLDVGEEFDLGLTGYASDGNYAGLDGQYAPTFTSSDPAVVAIKTGDYPHIVTVRAVGHGTATITARSGSLSIDLPVITGDAKPFTVNADVPPELRVNDVRIHVAPSQFPGGVMRLTAGEEADVSVEALLAADGNRATLEIYPPTWVTGDPAIATVKRKEHASGATVRGVKAGRTTLTVNVLGVKATIPVQIGPGATGNTQTSAGSVAGNSTQPFAVATPSTPSVGGSSGPALSVSAPLVFGMKGFQLERTQAGGAPSFGAVASNFRIAGNRILMTDPSPPTAPDPWLYRVTAIDQGGQPVPGLSSVLIPGTSERLASFTGRRLPAGIELTWPATAGRQYKVARFAPDGSGWTLLDVPASPGPSITFLDSAAPPAGTPIGYAVLIMNGPVYTGAGPTTFFR